MTYFTTQSCYYYDSLLGEKCYSYNTFARQILHVYVLKVLHEMVSRDCFVTMCPYICQICSCLINQHDFIKNPETSTCSFYR